MRLTLVLVAIAAAATAAPHRFQRRDVEAAKAFLPLIKGSANNEALVSNINTFFEHLGKTDNDIDDQLKAYFKNKTPTQQSANWVYSVLLHLVQ
ncbi:hypothetical protein DL89DRAFT_290823 [Linderina pennispora]|uniref:Uncharacterized protein n=1 Tax=Linderina pennispora TaxID=61395 RepID=A0A1Y1WHQ9_9FUNG|nr:uncharacterized protein DL89DRAFT_290823 [Linderina pennispora]ORX73047.1 hypothetical protein DL89DRAFT_290823 [Linderina pennispora]